MCDPDALPARLTQKIRVDSQSGCWEWMANRTTQGYGRVWVEGRLQQAHRVTYALLLGPIPDGLVLDHFLCDNPPCVNPEHLRPTTNRANVLRGSGPTAAHARVTHCPHGHPYAGSNLYVNKGKRYCRVCKDLSRRPALLPEETTP